MQPPHCRLDDIHRVRIVDSFEALIGTAFSGDINALCWRRDLAGNFDEIAHVLQSGEGITAIDDEDLTALDLSPDGCLARAAMLGDLALLRGAGLAPSLDCIKGYHCDEPAAVVPTDVYSFHVDSAPVEADTYLCTYTGAASEGLLNEDATRRIDVPETRALLLAAYGGPDDADFAAHLRERCYDLHYQSSVDARPYAFGHGNLWRIACAYPGSPVRPCIHRAPKAEPGAAPRLLLIS